MAEQKLEEIREVRLEKVKKLIELGINPYPSKPKGNPIDINLARKSDGKEVEVCGRIMSIRGHGNTSFFDLKDETGKIQLWLQQDVLKDDYKLLDLLDVGDILYAKGEITKTKAGEVSVNVSDFQLLTKSIRPLPSTWYGLKDEEERYRKRYLDLLLDDKLEDLFRMKAVFWQSMRQFLVDKGFLEVETPVLENSAGGADANPFVTHHNALDVDLYLRISMGELWQKRLMVAGFGKTFEIGRQFRNEGISREHLQDYSQMEFYWGYANYEDTMALVEEMYKYVAKKTFGTLKFKIGKFEVDMEGNWKRIDYSKTILDATGIDIKKASKEEIIKKLNELEQEYDKNDPKERLIDSLWKHVRKSIAGPVFLIGHPVEVSPLAKRDEQKPGFVERYQVILAGSEMGNGYSELNDPVDQRERFEKQQKMRDAGDVEAQMNDKDFVEALEYGMPPVSGFGVSERLFSFLADKPIRECVLFPLLRPDTVGNNKQDFDKKFVIVIDSKLPSWQVMNTSGHIAAFLGNKMTDNFDTGKHFSTKDGLNIPRNCQYPIITLSTNKSELKDLIDKVKDTALLFIGYVPEMMDTSDDKKLSEMLGNKISVDVEYAGVGIFGSKAEVDRLTKKYKLWE